MANSITDTGSITANNPSYAPEYGNLYQTSFRKANPLIGPAPGSISQPPWVVPPDGHQPYDFQFVIALPPLTGGTSSSGDVIVGAFLVPQGYDGVISAISQNFVGAGFTQGSGDIIWRLEQNNIPILNFDNMNTEKGTVAIPRGVNNIRIFSTQIISYIVNHMANVALNADVIVSVNGYFYPSTGQ